MSKPIARRAPRAQPHLQDVNRWRAWADARKDEAVHIAQEHLAACRRCRECGCEVTFMEKICPQCGACDPVRVPMSLPALLGVAIVVALCALIWVV